MKSNDYVIINNRAYDPVTGLLVQNHDLPANQAPAQNQNPIETSQPTRGIITPSVHRTIQKSTTLSRRYVQKPVVSKPVEATPATSQAVLPTVTNVRSVTAPRSESIQKFPSQQIIKSQPATFDRPAETHPLARRAANRSFDISPNRQRVINQQNREVRAMPTAPPQHTQQQKEVNRPVDSVKRVQKPAHVIKNEAIERALKNEIATKQTQSTKKHHKSNKWSRFVSLATGSLAIIMLAGYLTYLSMPNLSVRMAAVQSGVNASYPSYRPDGYSLNGPITFKDGEVAMKFAYAGDNQGFTLKQQRSNWDSSAVRQFVDTRTTSPTTTAVDGLTIYSYNNDAVWVNGGVLYTIESDAPLSNDQIQKLATSL